MAWTDIAGKRPPTSVTPLVVVTVACTDAFMWKRPRAIGPKLTFCDATRLRLSHTCGRDRASPKKSSPKIAENRRTLYRESPKILNYSPKLVSPIKLGLALS